MPALLEARALSYAFEKGRPILTGISLKVERGEFVVIAGRNGSGKTVLAKCLAGILDTKPESVLYQGTEYKKLKGSPATCVAYLFQDARLQILGDTLLDDVRFGLESLKLGLAEEEGRGRALLASVGLGGKESMPPWQLSGGEQRRLAIAGVLALAPSVLILDEPFANLDWQSVAGLLVLLDHLAAAGTTIVIVTHELEKVVGRADRLVVLEDGEVVADSTPRALVGAGLEAWGLRNPLRPSDRLEDLLWIGGKGP